MGEKINYRHGDVILVRVDTVQGEEQKGERVILAEGEVTGHMHQVTGGVAKIFKYNEKTYLKVVSEYVCLRHEEHKEIILPSGDYEYFIQREWKEDGWTEVTD